MAVWLAPPPIQLPASVASPRQAAVWPEPMIEGSNCATIHSASGPPRTMPTVAVRNMTIALLPRPRIPLMSIDSVIRNSAAGRK